MSMDAHNPGGPGREEVAAMVEKARATSRAEAAARRCTVELRRVRWCGI
jgi:hypothetical protein